MLFPTQRKESAASRRFRWLMNFYPVYFFSGGRLRFVSSHFNEIHVELKLSWYTKNYVGTIYGGSIYSACDPIYMLQLVKILGSDYVVWDKAATIKFIRPGKGKLKAVFLIEEEIISAIKKRVDAGKEFDMNFNVVFLNEEDKPVAQIEKTLYIASKEYYMQKRASKGQGMDFKVRK